MIGKLTFVDVCPIQNGTNPSGVFKHHNNILHSIEPFHFHLCVLFIFLNWNDSLDIGIATMFALPFFTSEEKFIWVMLNNI